MSGLPEGFVTLLQDDKACLHMAQGICANHHLAFDGARVQAGSHLLFAIGDTLMLKIFAPEESPFYETEKLFLTHLEGKLPIRTPGLQAAGTWERYPYLIMEKIPGVPLSAVWATLDQQQQQTLVRQIGEAVKTLHAVPTDALMPSPWNWTTFIDRQRQNLLTNHEKLGLEPHWLNQLEEYVATVTIDFHEQQNMVPLHTELMPDHFFVNPADGEWRLSGLIDFEPALVGLREYDFAAVGVFLTQGNPALFRTFLTAYGYQVTDLTDDFRRRLMILLLLHRYCRLSWFLQLIPASYQMTRLAQLEAYWFAF